MLKSLFYNTLIFLCCCGNLFAQGSPETPATGLSPEDATEAILNYQLPDNATLKLKKNLEQAKNFAVLFQYIAAKTPEEKERVLQHSAESGINHASILIRIGDYIQQIAAQQITPQLHQEYEEQLTTLTERTPSCISAVCAVLIMNPHASKEENDKKTLRFMQRHAQSNSAINHVNLAISNLFENYAPINDQAALDHLLKATELYVYTNSKHESTLAYIWLALERYCELKGGAHHLLRFGCLTRAFATFTPDHQLTEETNRIPYRLARYCRTTPPEWGIPIEQMEYCFLRQAASLQHPDAWKRLADNCPDDESEFKQKAEQAAKKCGWDAHTDYNNTPCKRHGYGEFHFIFPYSMHDAESFRHSTRICKLLSRASRDITVADTQGLDQNPFLKDIMRILRELQGANSFLNEDVADYASLTPEQQKTYDRYCMNMNMIHARLQGDLKTQLNVYQHGLGATRAGQSATAEIAILEQLAKTGDNDAFATLIYKALRQNPWDSDALDVMYELAKVGNGKAMSFFIRKDFAAGRYAYIPNEESLTSARERALAILDQNAWKQQVATAKTPEERLVALLAVGVSGSVMAIELDDALQAYAETSPETAKVVRIMRLLYLQQATNSVHIHQLAAAAAKLKQLLQEVPANIISPDAAQDFCQDLDMQQQKYTLVRNRRLLYDATNSGALQKLKKQEADFILLVDGNLIAQSKKDEETDLSAFLERMQDDTCMATLITRSINAKDAPLIIKYGIEDVYATDIEAQARTILEQKHVVLPPEEAASKP